MRPCPRSNRELVGEPEAQHFLSIEEITNQPRHRTSMTSFRLMERKVRDFETVRAEWPDLKDRVLSSDYAQRPSRRESGRRTGYDTELSK